MANHVLHRSYRRSVQSATGEGEGDEYANEAGNTGERRSSVEGQGLHARYYVSIYYLSKIIFLLAFYF